MRGFKAGADSTALLLPPSVCGTINLFFGVLDTADSGAALGLVGGREGRSTSGQPADAVVFRAVFFLSFSAAFNASDPISDALLSTSPLVDSTSTLWATTEPALSLFLLVHPECTSPGVD